MRMRFAQRPTLRCPPSTGSSDRTALTLTSGKLLASRWRPASVRLNLAGFRPAQQKSAQLRFRCAVYSQLWAAVDSVPNLEVRGQHFKRELSNGKYGENSNCYRCLARDRSGTRRSVLEARLQRSRKLATH